MRRAIVPGAFVVEALGSPVLVAAASLGLSRTAAAAAALLAALALQVVGAFVAAWTLGARRHALRVAPLRVFARARVRRVRTRSRRAGSGAVTRSASAQARGSSPCRAS
jgi:hypothetical protein